MERISPVISAPPGFFVDKVSKDAEPGDSVSGMFMRERSAFPAGFLKNELASRKS